MDTPFCPVCGKRVSIAYSVHLPMPDDSTGYLHAMCWLSMSMQEMSRAIETLNMGLTTLSMIMSDPAAELAVEAKVVAMAKARARADQQEALPAAPTPYETTYGSLERREDVKPEISQDAVAVCPSVSTTGEVAVA